MNNLYRELAPITEAAWAEIETEATRTFKRHIAGRRVVDVSDPGGPVTAAVSTGHLLDVAAPGDGVLAHLRESKPLVRLRVPFTIRRTDIDDVERGSQDSDWDPVKDAAKQLAFAEDRAIFEGYEDASIAGIRKSSSNPSLAVPEDPREIPDVIAQALSELRLAGVDGPYSVLLSADVYTAVSDNHRPRLFLKDAGGRRTVGPGHAIGIRGDSTWTVPEPEIAVVIGGKGSILGYTIANDITSREIEGANPLFLTQAKVHGGCCAIGPSIFVPEYEPSGFQIVMRISDEEGEVLYQDTATTAQMTRSFPELVAWLVRDNPVPAGTVLLTGTGLVLPDELNLLPGQWVEIHVPEIGTLVNHVVLASDLA